MFMRKAALLALPLACTATPAARADLLRDWNVVVTGNAYVRSETEGPVRVGGDLYLVEGGYGISPRAGTLAATGRVGLMVGGNVKGAQLGGVKLNQETDSPAGSLTSAVVGGGGTPADAFANGPVAFDAGIQGIGAADAALLKGYSEGFKDLAVTNYYQIVNGNQGRFEVAGNSTGNAVFNVTAAEVFGNGGIGELSLKLNGRTFAAGESIVINVTGDVSYVGAKNLVGDFDSAIANIIWNFHDATSIDMKGYGNLKGAMLAYQATLRNTNTIDGAVFVARIGDAANPYGGQGAEIHPPLYRGFVPTTTAVPEPSSLAMAGVALAAGATFARRRRVPA